MQNLTNKKKKGIIKKKLEKKGEFIIKKKKIKKNIICGILGGLILISTVIPTYANVNNKSLSGGWSELNGYYSQDNTLLKSPQKHLGRKLSRIWNNAGDVEVASQGETWWSNVYHYTNARVEDTRGGVLTESGRIYGTGYTKATSPYYKYKLLENVECRTYWGN